MGIEIILQKIKQYDRIMLHGHIRPDGDCYGSQFGLKDIIKTTFPEKEVYVVGQVCEYTHFLGEPDEVTDEMYEGALAIVVDTATQARVSDQRFKLAKEVIKIDHHIPIDQYGDVIWVIEEAPAAAQMVTYFFYKFQKELKITKAGATALYTGIVTDTGGFRYRGVNEVTHILAGFLVKHGAEPADIDFCLSQQTLESVKLKGHVLSNFKTSPNGFIYFKMTRDIINKYQLSDEEAASMIGSLSGIKDHPVWALVIEYPNEIRIRLRSNGPDIDDVANQFNGGGHAKAAGGRLNSFDDIDKLIKAVDQKIINWRKEN